MDNIWRHSDKTNTITLKGKVTQKVKIIDAPSKTTIHIYDSHRKVNKTRLMMMKLKGMEGTR